MAKTDEKVMSLVEEELEKNPDASVDQLYEKAKDAHPSVGELSKRQFNARYPLQVKRRKSQPSPGTTRTRRRTTRKSTSPRTRTGNGGSRDRVRETFLRFASDLVAAEERKDLVEVLAGVDHYVEEVLKATDGS